MDDEPKKPQPPFNGGLSLTSRPHVPPSWINWKSSRALQPHEALKANTALAALLDRVDRQLAERLRSCAPSYRCDKWRYCAICGPIREARLVQEYQARLLRPAELAHVTLTTRAIERLTRQALQDLAAKYNLLRRQKRFKQAVGGVIVNIQAEHGASGWLVHLHAVIDHRGGLSKTWLKDQWSKLGGGWSVDFQIIVPETQHRVLAYGARSPDLPHDSQLLWQFYSATRGYTLIRASGSFHRLHGRPRRRRAQVTA